MRRLVRTLVLVAIVALVAAIPASAKPSDGVPINGSIVGVDSMGPPQSLPGYPDCPAGTSWRYFSEGSGNMSHLGLVDVFVTHCSVFDEVTGAGTFGGGTIAFTAANGDRLVIAQSGTFQLIGDPTSDEFLSLIEGEWTIVDGDGRFEGSSGSGSLTGVSDLLQGEFGITSVDFIGEIAYDASQRSK